QSRARRPSRDRRRGRLPGRAGRALGDPRAAGHAAGRDLGAVKPDYPLLTERLSLRPFAATDFEALLAIQSRADVARYLYWDPRPSAEVGEALAVKMRSTAIVSEGDSLGLAAELRATGELIGECNLHWTSAEHRQGEIGFVLHPDHHGRGYATEAAE